MDANTVNKQYKLGYCMCVVNAEQKDRYKWLEEKASLCEKFVLGIPDEWVMARLFGDKKKYNVEKEKQFWLDTGWIAEVIILNAEMLSYQKIYETVKFDVCFYGTEYGVHFAEDKCFMDDKGIEFVSLAPEKYNRVAGRGTLKLAIDDLQRRQSIVLFGTGVYFDIYMKEYGKLGEKYIPKYAVDNNSDKWNTVKEGIKIVAPSVLQTEKPEDILIIICSKNYEEILQQIKELGNFNYRTMRFMNEITLLEEFAIISAEERAYLKKSHEILSILMKEFDRVCQENKLHYYVICGSLIGVIRHKNMIPWDDDIDIAMPRKDYKKLKRIAKKEWKKNETFQFLNYTDIGGGAFLDCMPRLYYMKDKLPIKCIDKVYGKATADIEDRLFIDIYVMDSAHENEKVHNVVIVAMKGVYNLMMGHRAYVNYDEYRRKFSDKQIKLMKVLHGIGKLFPIRFLAFCYDTLARSGNFNKKAKDYIMESCAITCIERRYPKKHYGEGLRLPFADIEVMVPSDYDSQLFSMWYRNYMEFPRLSIRKPSHYFNSDIEIW